MQNLATCGRRLRIRRLKAIVFFGIGAIFCFLLIFMYIRPSTREILDICAFVSLGISAIYYLLSRELPKKEIMQLALSSNGMVTLSDIATTLEIDPDLALHTLRRLQKVGIANLRWQEYQKNLWEFPDYLKLPIAQTIDIAKKNGGRLSMKDLLAAGHSVDVAQQTLTTLTEKGLAQQDPTSPTSKLILESQ